MNEVLTGNVILTGIGSIVALVFAFITAIGILRKSEGTEAMKNIAQYIREGADAYLKRQYIGVFLFFMVMVGILSFMASKGYLTWFVPFAFFSGGFFSGLAGFIGMKVATRSNARTAWAAKTSLNSGLSGLFSTAFFTALHLISPVTILLSPLISIGFICP